MRSDSSRRSRGARKIGEVLGQTPEQVERSLGDVAPQLATYVLETIYGEIYQSSTLDSRTRQIVTVAALASTAPVNHRGSGPEWFGIQRSVTVPRKF
jgi:4-carboxymuconolactone decarboxylase